MIRLLLLLTALLGSGFSHAQQQHLAQEYLNALTDRNYQRLASYYSRETILSDKTAIKSMTGRRDILAFLRRVHTYTEDYRFEVEHSFNSGSLVVFIGHYHYQARGDLFGKPNKSILVKIPAVTTIKVDLGKQRIVEHIDLLDYDSMTQQLALQ